MATVRRESIVARLREVRVSVPSFAEDVVNQILDEEFNRIKSDDWYMGTRYMVEAMLDANCKDEDIIQSLCKYWDMNQSDAQYVLSTIKTISHPEGELRRYLQVQGYSEDEISSFILSKNVQAELKANHDLWKKTPNQLFEFFNPKNSNKKQKT